MGARNQAAVEPRVGGSGGRRGIIGRTNRRQRCRRAALRGGTFRGVLALGDLAAKIDAALTGPGRRLCYGYHSDLDTLGHVHGPGTLPWRLQLRQIDLLVSTFAAALPPDALLVVTGDHGMVTVDRAPDFDTDETLQAGVTLLGGDARARHVYTAPGAAADVLATWQDVLGGDAWVVTRDEAVAAGWFGPLGPHVAGRIGDVVAAMRGGTALVRSQAEPKLAKLVGQHGSLTSAEQLVPLLVAGPES